MIRWLLFRPVCRSSDFRLPSLSTYWFSSNKLHWVVAMYYRIIHCWSWICLSSMHLFYYTHHYSLLLLKSCTIFDKLENFELLHNFKVNSDLLYTGPGIKFSIWCFGTIWYIQPCTVYSLTYPKHVGRIKNINNMLVLVYLFIYEHNNFNSSSLKVYERLFFPKNISRKLTEIRLVFTVIPTHLFS